LVGGTPGCEAGYLCFLGSQLVAPLDGAFAGVLAGRRELDPGALAWHAGYDYYNFVETPAEAEVVLPPASYERLQRIKATYDPDETIISAHPVRPAVLA
jgi:hypothetical protein